MEQKYRRPKAECTQPYKPDENHQSPIEILTNIICFRVKYNRTERFPVGPKVSYALDDASPM